MRIGAYIPCPLCKQRAPISFMAEGGKSGNVVLTCPNCRSSFDARLSFKDGVYPKLEVDGVTYDVGAIPFFAKASFECESCGSPREVHITPPHPKLDLPVSLGGHCPDCGHKFVYEADYDEAGKLRVKINSSIIVYPK